jgi:hypothetical protein
MADLKKNSKQARTSINHPLAREIHRENRRLVEKLAEEIHIEALKLPLYRLTFERLGLKGPALAYLLSHDGWALKTLPREKLIFRFQMTGRRKHKKRKTRSRLLIMLAMSAVLHKHPTYYQVYQRYFGRFKAEGYSGKKAYWKAILRVAERILRDIYSLGRGSKIVFVDFGRNKVYALEDDGDEVMVFDDFAEMVEKLKPKLVVADAYPRKLLPLLANLAENGITFLKLKDPKLLAEARRRYGYRKSDENDVKLLRQMRPRNNIETQTLSPDEVSVRALTELWVQMADLKKNSKQARTSINHPLAREIHRENRRLVEKLAEEIHKEALKLPLYRLVFEQLGLKGPTKTT